MKKISEKSFGQRLAKARQLIEVLKSIPDYTVSNAMLSVEAFNSLLTETEAINQQATEAKSRLAIKRELRNELYYEADGLFSIVKRIRDYVASLPNGKQNSHYKSIVLECQKMMSTKSNSRKELITLKESELPIRKISSSEKSFGSTLQSAKNILVQIGMIDSYEPSPPSLTKQKLQEAINAVETINIEVHQEFVKVNEAVSNRVIKYDGTGGLQDCFQKIKLHLAGAYGKDSNIFLEASRIRI
ncbi:MAG: hypothetical protein ABI851_14195 [Saprospiraceae bacterium]